MNIKKVKEDKEDGKAIENNRDDFLPQTNQRQRRYSGNAD